MKCIAAYPMPVNGVVALEAAVDFALSAKKREVALVLKSDTDLVNRIDAYGKNLTSWEVGFVESISRRVKDDRLPLTEGQRTRARQIDEERVR